MTQFNIPPSKKIPSFDDDHRGGFINTVKNSGKRRGVNPVAFGIRKTKNIILYRLAYFCPINSWRILFHRWRGVNIGKRVYIGIQCSIDNAYPELVFIGDNAAVNQGAFILAHTNARSCFRSIVESKAAPVHIKQNALVSINSTILPGIEIGEYSIVSAGSVVINNVNPFTVVAGNPAKKVANIERLVRRNI